MDLKVKAKTKKSNPKHNSESAEVGSPSGDEVIFVPPAKDFFDSRKKILSVAVGVLLAGGIFYLLGDVFSLKLPSDPDKALEVIFKQNEKVKSANFNLSTAIDDKVLEDKPVNLEGLSIDTEGSIVFPDRIKTKSKYQANDPLARTIFLKNFDFETIVIGKKKFQKNFLEDYWREGVNTFELGEVSNPLDYLKYASLYKDPASDVESRVGDYPCYRFNYEVDASKLDAKTKEALRGGSIKISLWADKESFFIRRLRAIIEIPDDNKRIDALIDFKDFNDKSILVEEPRGI